MLYSQFSRHCSKTGPNLYPGFIKWSAQSSYENDRKTSECLFQQWDVFEFWVFYIRSPYIQTVMVYSGGLNTKHWSTEHIEILNFEVLFQKQDGSHFVLFFNGSDHWKTKLLASLDHFIYKQYWKTEQNGCYFVNHWKTERHQKTVKTLPLEF